MYLTFLSGFFLSRKYLFFPSSQRSRRIPEFPTDNLHCAAGSRRLWHVYILIDNWMVQFHNLPSLMQGAEGLMQGAQGLMRGVEGLMPIAKDFRPITKGLWRVDQGLGK
jgi:hypothetical protein